MIPDNIKDKIPDNIKDKIPDNIKDKIPEINEESIPDGFKTKSTQPGTITEVPNVHGNHCLTDAGCGYPLYTCYDVEPSVRMCYVTWWFIFVLVIGVLIFIPCGICFIVCCCCGGCNLGVCTLGVCFS